MKGLLAAFELLNAPIVEVNPELREGVDAWSLARFAGVPMSVPPDGESARATGDLKGLNALLEPIRPPKCDFVGRVAEIATRFAFVSVEAAFARAAVAASSCNNLAGLRVAAVICVVYIIISASAVCFACSLPSMD